MVQRSIKQGYQMISAHLRQVYGANEGFLLPVVIALGLGIGTVSVVALQTVAQNSSTLSTQSYSQIAREAAQAGVAAATSCIKSTNPLATAWTNSNPLTPDKNCAIATPAGNIQKAFIDDNSQYQSTYSVIRPAYQTNNTSMLITSTGKVYTKIAGSSNRALAAEVTVHGYGVFPTDNTLIPVNYKKVKEISTGSTTTCTVAEDDWAYCWGSNANNMLGTGKNYVGNRVTSPTAVAKTAVAADSGVCSARDWFGNCVAWDPNSWAAQPINPMAASGNKVTKISVGATHTCAVATDSNGANGKAYCWGKNTTGQLGNYTNTDSSVPVAVDTDGARAAIPANPGVCAWFQWWGACGGYSVEPSAAVPARPASALQNQTVVDITAGDGFTCALTSPGNVVCWGDNANGQLGINSRTQYTYPVAVDNTFAGTPAIAPIPANPGVCAWYEWWGGCGGYSVQPSPAVPGVAAVPASALYNKTVTKLAQLKGGSTMCVVTNTDDPACWGQNYAGQVGNGVRAGNITCGASSPRSSVGISTSADALRPASVSGSIKFKSFTVYDSYTTAISTSGRAYWWGGTTAQTTCTYDPGGGGGGLGCGGAGSGNPGCGGPPPETHHGRTYTAQATPAGPLYDTGTTTINSWSLALTSGNPKNGLFCGLLSTNNQIYCDANGTSSAEGQTGSNYTPNCYPVLWYTQCDPAPTGPQPVTMSAFGGISIADMDTGTSGYTCAVTSDGQVYCWGLNTSGQLGVLPAANLPANYRKTPSPVDINQNTSALYSPPNTGGNGSGTTNGAFTLKAIY